MLHGNSTAGGFEMPQLDRPFGHYPLRLPSSSGLSGGPLLRLTGFLRRKLNILLWRAVRAPSPVWLPELTPGTLSSQNL